MIKHTVKQIVSDINLWREYFDYMNVLSEERFNQISEEEKTRVLLNCKPELIEVNDGN